MKIHPVKIYTNIAAINNNQTFAGSQKRALSDLDYNSAKKYADNVLQSKKHKICP